MRSQGAAPASEHPTDGSIVAREDSAGDLIVSEVYTGDLLRVDPDTGSVTTLPTLSFPAGVSLVPTDGDLDGVATAVEEAAPNGGDGDGVPDSEQSDVASVPDAEGVGYVTLQVSGSCSIATSVMTMTEADAPEPDPGPAAGGAGVAGAGPRDGGTRAPEADQRGSTHRLRSDGARSRPRCAADAST